MSGNPDSKNVARDLKASITNPHVSDTARENAEERLSNVQNEPDAAETIQGDGGKNTGNVIGGHKATISNPRTSEEVKEHARDVLEKLQQRG